MPDLNELADRVERASGADRELDALICEATGVEPQARAMLQFPAYDKCVRYYTASLDAALTLVPEGYGWQFNSGGSASVWDHLGVWKFHALAATPALALVAAALRSRATQQESNHERA